MDEIRVKDLVSIDTKGKYWLKEIGQVVGIVQDRARVKLRDKIVSRPLSQLTKVQNGEEARNRF